MLQGLRCVVGSQVAHLADNAHRLAVIDLGVDLSREGRAVPQDDAGRLDAVLLPDARRGGVPELVRVPAVLPLPGPDLGPLLLAQPGPPSRLALQPPALYPLPSESLGKREGHVAASLDRPAVTDGVVALPLRALRGGLPLLRLVRQVRRPQRRLAARSPFRLAHRLGTHRAEDVVVRSDIPEPRIQHPLGTRPDEDPAPPAVVGRLVPTGPEDPDLPRAVDPPWLQSAHLGRPTAGVILNEDHRPDHRPEMLQGLLHHARQDGPDLLRLSDARKPLPQAVDGEKSVVHAGRDHLLL